MDGKSCVLPCMSFRCGKLCDEERVLPLIRELPEVAAKYKTARLQSYLEGNNKVKFCCSVPWCGRAIEVGGGGFDNLTINYQGHIYRHQDVN